MEGHALGGLRDGLLDGRCIARGLHQHHATPRSHTAEQLLGRSEGSQYVRLLRLLGNDDAFRRGTGHKGGYAGDAFRRESPLGQQCADVARRGVEARIALGRDGHPTPLVTFGRDPLDGRAIVRQRRRSVVAHGDGERSDGRQIDIECAKDVGRARGE